MALVPDDPHDDPAQLRRPEPPRSWRDRLEQVADATGTSPARIALGAAALAAAALAVLWLTRPPPPPPEAGLPFASTTESLAPASSAPSVQETIVVHVAGAVVAPGVRELPAESRVADAVAAAGGLLPEADGARLNLAAKVQDGERVYVPRVGEVVPAAIGGSGAGSGAADSGPLNLNEADEDALDALPGIGPATAAAIVQHRTEIGRFTSVDQLLDVRGIGPAKLEQLRPLVTV
ncbi:MAG: ComEA family DNA-binding protein [Microthrixaceae bacterium]